LTLTTGISKLRKRKKERLFFPFLYSISRTKIMRKKQEKTETEKKKLNLSIFF